MQPITNKQTNKGAACFKSVWGHPRRGCGPPPSAAAGAGRALRGPWTSVLHGRALQFVFSGSRLRTLTTPLTIRLVPERPPPTDVALDHFQRGRKDQATCDDTEKTLRFHAEDTGRRRSFYVISRLSALRDGFGLRPREDTRGTVTLPPGGERRVTADM